MGAITKELATPDEGGDRRDFYDWDEELRSDRPSPGNQFAWGAERSGATIRSFIHRPLGRTGLFGAGNPQTDYMSLAPKQMPEVVIQLH